jgi:hypothetical protein
VLLVARIEFVEHEAHAFDGWRFAGIALCVGDVETHDSSRGGIGCERPISRAVHGVYRDAAVAAPTRASVADADADRAGARAFVLSILLDDLSDEADATRAQPAVAEPARALRAVSVRLQRADARGVDRSAEAAAAACSRASKSRV